MLKEFMHYTSYQYYSYVLAPALINLLLPFSFVPQLAPAVLLLVFKRSYATSAEGHAFPLGTFGQRLT